MLDQSTRPSIHSISEKELALFESIPGNNVLLQPNSPKFTILGVTDTYLVIAGKKREELIGRDLFEVFPSNPNDPKDTGETDLRSSLNQVLLHKKKHEIPSQRYDVQNETGSFEERYWYTGNTPMLDHDNQVKYIIHSVTEITDQVKAAQREVKIQSIEKEHGLFMQAPMAIQILMGPQLIIEMVNEPTLAIWQKGKDIIGKRLIDVLPELADQEFLKILKRVRNTGQTYKTLELPISFFRDGNPEEHYFNLAFQPIYDAEKSKIEGLLVYANEVTSQVIAKKALRKTEEENKKLAAIAEASHEFIGMAEPDGTILYLNPAALNMLGWNSFAGKHIIDTIYQDDLELAKEILPKFIEKGTFSHEIRLLNEKTGEPFWLLWNAFTIRDAESGELTNLATVSPNITERKKQERALKESHQRFEAAIQAIQGILWTNNAEGQMVGEQKGWAELTGQSYEEYQGYGWSNAVHPEDAQASVNAWNESVQQRKTFIFDHRVKMKDGNWGVFAVRAVPLLNENGSIREWVGVHTNITDQKKSEQNIRESEERFRNLADESPMFVFIIDPLPEAPVNYWNKTWLEYTGQTLEEARGRAWDGIIHPDDIPVVMEFYAPAFQNRESYFIPSVRVKRHDGIYRWHSFKGNPRYLANGEFNGYIGVGFDIHEQKLSEEAIKQSESQLQIKVAERTAQLQNQKNLLDNILINSSNGISVTEMIRNEKGFVIDASTILANEAAIRYTGLPKDVYLGKTAVEVDPNILISPYGQTCLKTLETGEPALIQYFLELTGKWLELTISKMDDDHLIHIFTDVTHIKESQLQLERTVEELRRSNANLEEFAYAASHDLKEPVRKIHFFSGRLRETLENKLNENERNFFDRMENASKRMGSLIDDLLSYSQVSLRPKSFEEVDLNQLINLVLEDLDLEIDQKGARLRVEKLGVIRGHHRQLQQAFQNLIGNALKYNKPDAPPEIKIRSRRISGKDSELNLAPEEAVKTFSLIEIEDNGIGFEQRDADRIFNVFTRLHSNVEYRGTGVGLSIVRKVIENHNGYISAKSELGKGSIFKLFLPEDI